MRILHTMIRVGNLEKSIEFYTKAFGMEVIKHKEYPDGKFTLVFLGYGSEDENTLLELTYNWGVHGYEIGTGFGHIAISTPQIEETCALAKEYGGTVTREPAPMKFGSNPRNIAFVADPDGYKIELIEHQSVFGQMHTRVDFGGT